MGDFEHEVAEVHGQLLRFCFTGSCDYLSQLKYSCNLGKKFKDDIPVDQSSVRCDEAMPGDRVLASDAGCLASQKKAKSMASRGVCSQGKNLSVRVAIL